MSSMGNLLTHLPKYISYMCKHLYKSSEFFWR